MDFILAVSTGIGQHRTKFHLEKYCAFELSSIGKSAILGRVGVNRLDDLWILMNLKRDAVATPSRVPYRAVRGHSRPCLSGHDADGGEARPVQSKHQKVAFR